MSAGGRRSGPLIVLTSLALYGLLWVPLVVVVVWSFNAARYGGEWKGFTLQWYVALWRHDAALAAARNTLLLAAVSTLVATVLGTLLGYAMGRGPFRGRDGCVVLLRLPMVLPDIVFAVGLLMFFATLRRWVPWVELGMGAMILGHVSFQIPFVAWVVWARCAGMDVALEEAARDLGATPIQTFWHVTLPLLRPGVLAGGLLAFTLSLDDFAVSFFTGGPGSTTLPVLIYASARRGITPELHALSTLLLGLTVAVVLAARGFGARRQEEMSSSFLRGEAR